MGSVDSIRSEDRRRHASGVTDLARVVASTHRAGGPGLANNARGAKGACGYDQRKETSDAGPCMHQSPGHPLVHNMTLDLNK